MAKTLVEFSKDELKQLLEDESSCVCVKNSVYNLALYPYHLGDYSSSIKELLNSRISKFEKRLGGILLGYRNVKLLTSEGTIVTDTCHVHIDIEADFYVFKPEIGSTLKGIVNKKSGDHVGCLVHRVFNVSVPKQDQNDEWIGYLVEIGQEVVLNVTYLDIDARLPYIRAAIDPEHFVLPETSTEKKKNKNGLNETIQNGIEDDELMETPVHKKKKHKSSINELINSYEEDDQGETQKQKKKKRKSKDVDQQEDIVEEVIQKNKKKKDKRKSKDNSLIDNNDEILSVENSVNKALKDEQNAKIKKKRHSKSLEVFDEVNESISIKKKKKNLHLTQDFEALNNEQISTPINNERVNNKLTENKTLKTKHTKSPGYSPVTAMADIDDRKTKIKQNSKRNGVISWENVSLNLHDSELELDTLANDLQTEVKSEKLDKDNSHKKHKKDKISEEDEQSASKKKRKRSDDSFSEEPTSKRHKHNVPEEENLVKKHKSKKKHLIDT